MTVATLIQDLRRRGVAFEPAGAWLDVDDPKGVLTEADLETLRQRKALILAFLRWEARGRAPVVLSAAWPKAGSWQHAYATTGRHPLACPQCGALTLRPGLDGRLGCAPCEAATRSATTSSSPS